MKYHPLISILVPIYGVEKYIARCAKSLFEQTYDNIEYVFVDDCTPDNSIGILKDVLNQYLNRQDAVRIIKHEKNQGLAVARNTAVATAKGEYLMHVDSDDWIETNTVALCVEKLNAFNADIIYFGTFKHAKSNIIIINPDKVSSTEDKTLLFLSRRIIINIWGQLIKANLYIDNNISVPLGLNNGEDYDIAPKLCYYAKSIETINKPLYHYDFTNIESYSHVFSSKKWEQTWRVIEDLQSFFKDKGSEYLNALNKGTVDVLIRILVDIGRFDGGRDYFNIIHKRASLINKKNIRISPFYKLVLYIPSYTILQLYCKFSYLLKRLLDK